MPPASDNVYEYIVFRGSDVKDLRIEEGPKEPERPKPPQVPDDPAILGVSAPKDNNGRTCSIPYTTADGRNATCFLMKKYGCKTKFIKPRAQNRVDISVAFLLKNRSL